METTTPRTITKQIQRLATKVAPGQQPVFLTVDPAPGAMVNECFPNVDAMIQQGGGSMVCGWQIWEWPHVMIEAEFHAVWLSPKGELLEITPKQQGEGKILFVPDPSMRYTGLAKDNVRMALRDDLLVHHFIRTSEEIVKVLNRGSRAREYGYVSVPAQEIAPLAEAQSFLGESLSMNLRDHQPCLCGSGGKYKQCHGRIFRWHDGK